MRGGENGAEEGELSLSASEKAISYSEFDKLPIESSERKVTMNDL